MAVGERSGSRIRISGARAVPNPCLHGVQVAVRHGAAVSVSRSLVTAILWVNVSEKERAMQRHALHLVSPVSTNGLRRARRRHARYRGRLHRDHWPRARRQRNGRGRRTARGAASPGAGAAGTTGAGNATVTGTGAGSGGVAGSGAGTAGTGGTGGTPVVFAPSPGAYRRLTASAFRNSLRDLLQGPVTIGGIEPDSWSVGGLASVSAATVSISAAGVEQYQTAIDAATSQALPTPPAGASCSAAPRPARPTWPASSRS